MPRLYYNVNTAEKNKLDAPSVFSNIYWCTLIICWFYFIQQKCIQYWPDSNKKKETFGSTDIILTKEDVCSDFTVRHLQLQQVCLLEKYTAVWCSIGQYRNNIIIFLLYMVNSSFELRSSNYRKKDIEC